MRKRLPSKLLSIVLSLAICATTVLGCLMTVSADASCYSFSAPVIDEEDPTKASVNVTFTAPASLTYGFTAGLFSVEEVNADASDYLILEGVNGVTDGANASFDGNTVVFDCTLPEGAETGFTTVTLELVFGFSLGEMSEDKDYEIQLSSIELAYDENVYTQTAAGSTVVLSLGCKHVIGVVGDPLDVNTTEGYSVYENSVCVLCGETFGYQLVPTTEPLNNDTTEDLNVVYVDSADINLPSGVEAFMTENTGTADDPIVISTAGELRYLVQKSTYETTHGKYFEIDENIDILVLQYEGYLGDLDEFMAKDATEVKDYFEANSTANGKDKVTWQAGTSNANDCFSGILDGNGVQIVGYYTGAAGLINAVNEGTVIKNLTVSHCYSTASWYASALVGAVYQSNTYLATKPTNDTCYGRVDFENIILHDNFIKNSGNAQQSTGILLGNVIGTSYDGTYYNHVGVKVHNCLTYDNKALAETGSGSGTFVDHPYLFGILSSSYNGLNSYPNGSYTNSIFLDCAPYAYTNSNQAFRAPYFTNVYTTVATDHNPTIESWYTWDQFDITIADIDDFKGVKAYSTCSEFDWSGWNIDTDGGYPTPVQDGGVATHETIFWDGTYATGFGSGSGTAEDPYIISTAAELAYLVKDYTSGSTGYTTESFKIADGIKNIVLQKAVYGADIMALADSAAVKSYFEANAANMIKWANEGWEQGSFAGTFDGNGATVYGLYQDTLYNAGLFTTVDAGCTIKNIAVKNSYMKSTYSDGGHYQIGGIAAVTSGTNYGIKNNGVIWIDGCEVSNCYMIHNTTQTTRCGVILGSANVDAAYITNCIVYGNDATYGDGVNMPLLGNPSGEAQFATAIAPDGLTLVPRNNQEGHTHISNGIHNTIAIGTAPYNSALNIGWGATDPYVYQNVYTDQPAGTVTFANTTHTYTEAQIKNVAADSITGTGAKAQMTALNWGTDWYCGAINEYPIPAAFVTQEVSTLSNSSFELLGSNVTYNNDGSFDFNFHFVPESDYFVPDVYVGTVDCEKFMVLSPVASSLRSELGENAMMYTIPNLSVRDIHRVWLPTMVTPNGAIVEWGMSQQLAIIDHAKTIVAGDYDQADKNVSAALLGYAEAANTALSTTTNTAATKNVVYVDSADINLPSGVEAFMTENTGTEDDPIVISTVGELRYLVQKSTYATTHGKYFEIDENIDILVLQYEGYLGDLDEFMAKDATAVMEYLVANETANGKGRTQWQSGSSNVNDCFSGTLDGNGVQIVGCYTANGGIFSTVNEGAAFKNITVSNSYFTAGWFASAFIGAIYPSSTYIATAPTNDTCYGRVDFEGIALYDNYVKNSGNARNNTGTLLGAEITSSGYSHVGVKMDRCLTHSNVVLAETGSDTGEFVDHPYLFGILSTGYNGMNSYPNGSYTDSIILDCAPYAWVNSNQAFRAIYYTNVYTNVTTDHNPTIESWYTWDQFDITIADASAYAGTAALTTCSKLDFSEWIIDAYGDYPMPVQTELPETGKTIYWDGTAATGFDSGSGTADDPYIIATAAQLAYLVKDYTTQASLNNSAGQYFKIADGIDNIVLQSETYAADIMRLGNSDEVKAYFEANAANMIKWVNEGWEQGAFCGTFDGNGATVYGLYQDNIYNAGLFTTVDAGCTIKNIAVKNSYMKSSYSDSGHYQIGGIAAVTSGTSYGAKNVGVIWIDGCEVSNCYMIHDTTQTNRCGVVLGSASADCVYVTNCIVYGNDATYGEGVSFPLVAERANSATFSGSVIPEGMDDILVHRQNNSSSDQISNGVHNTISIGTAPYNNAVSIGWGSTDPYVYQNVYTDQPAGTITFANNTHTFTEAQIMNVAAADIKGENAKNVITAESFWAEDGGLWYTGSFSDYPGFEQAANIPAETQNLINNVNFDLYDDFADSTAEFGVYATALSLKANPYMSFAFAFHGDYKTNRDKISIRFTYTVNGTEYTTETVTPPAYVEGQEIKNVDGWTNIAKNGRYHTYKAEQIPVEALAYGIKVEGSYNGGSYVNFGTFSVSGLGNQFEAAYKATPNDYYLTRIEATKALLFYAQMIHARYGNV